MWKELVFSVADLHNQLALTKFGILLGHLEKDVNSTLNNREKKGRQPISPEDEVALVWHREKIAEHLTRSAGKK